MIPVYAQLAADFDTPLSVYAKLRSEYAFLLESAESSKQSGRWSIVGSQPRKLFIAKGSTLTIQEGNSRSFIDTQERDVLDCLREQMAAYRVVSHGDAPPFFGGLVGFLGYDAISQFEPTVQAVANDELGIADACFMLADKLVIFDHHSRRMLITVNAIIDEGQQPEDVYRQAVDAIALMLAKLQKPLEVAALNGHSSFSTPDYTSNTTQEQYEAMVHKAKEHIACGDIFQVVPSQRFSCDYNGDALDLYRALRHVNPSPYMFLLALGNFTLVGSSPEVHVRCIDKRLDIRPIAGTRWRGATQAEDDALALDLLNDPKERAEHVMLVDLARNDLGRIAQPGSVVVDDFMIIERYSHVMHIVSNVHATLADGQDGYDALRATFPAGTVSGAPKIKAMQILSSMEVAKRCAYAGAVGYFAWDGNMDTCITLRTCLLKDGKAYVQAGAGVVADSDATYEYNETCNKAKGMLRAIGLAKSLGQQQ